jgi:hypothetical protein
MNQNQIKILATVLMLIDHIGFMIDCEIMRIIGRFSFPLFCWVFAQNWKRPGDKEKLIKRMGLFGVLSQIPHIMLFNNGDLNVLMSFFFCALTLKYINESQQKIVILCLGLFVSELIQANYGWYTIACTILMINFDKESQTRWWLCWIAINLIYAATGKSIIQFAAVLTPMLLKHHNPEKDRKPTELEKKFFYYFYPLHLAGLAAIRSIIL